MALTTYAARRSTISNSWLWIGNGRCYAQLTVEDVETGQKQVRRPPLEGTTTPAQASQKFEGPHVNRQLTLGSDGEVKNRKWPVVDFNPELEELQEMHPRRVEN